MVTPNSYSTKEQVRIGSFSKGQQDCWVKPEKMYSFLVLSKFYEILRLNMPHKHQSAATWKNPVFGYSNSNIAVHYSGQV